MDGRDWQVDVRAELEPLKAFQRRTVDNAFAHLYTDPHPVDSFLVADEVGLGKTLVARGVIARTVDHLLRVEGRDQARILYICSNSQIARQNLPKLSMGPSGITTVEGAARLTLMNPGSSRSRLTFTAFTPGTSIKFGDRFGEVHERVRLHLLLSGCGLIDEDDPRGRAAWSEFLRGGVKPKRFRCKIMRQLGERERSWSEEEYSSEEHLAHELRCELDAGVRGASRCCLPGGGLDTEILGGIVAEFRGRSWDDVGRQGTDLWNRSADALLALRRTLARLVARSFRPDLIVLDEFQRFKDLLPDPSNEVDGAQHDSFPEELMSTMMGRTGGSGEGAGGHAKSLLLSATPYRMYTQAGDAQSEDHYSDFVATVRALADGGLDERAGDPAGSAALLGDGDSAHPHADAVQEGLAEIRLAMRSGDVERAQIGRDRVERELRRIMSRTERLASTPGRDGMLATTGETAAALTPADVADYLSLRGVARAVGSRDPLELWRSAPYTLAMMGGTRYDLARRLQRVADAERDAFGVDHMGDDRHAALLGALSAAGHTLVVADGSAPGAGPGEAAVVGGGEDGGGGPPRAPELVAANPKMRALIRDVLGGDGAEESWRMVWMPPSMPRHVLAGPYHGGRRFTKRLVFSHWNVAPKSIAVVVSNRAGALAREACGDEWSSLPDALRPQYRKETHTLSRVWAWSLVYPSAVLARLGDVTAFARRTGEVLPVDSGRHRDDVAARLGPLLRRLDERHGGGRSGAADARWYGVAGVLLDRMEADESGHGATWVGPGRLGLVKSLRKDPEGIRAHLEALDARAAASGVEGSGGGVGESGGQLPPLGAQPDDLAEFLAAVAVGAPGVCALRALAGALCGDDPEKWRDGLGSVGARSGAMRIGWAMLGLFNRPEIQAAVWAGAQVTGGSDAEPGNDESRSWAYARTVLGQCLAGDLDAVLPEYVHQLEAEARTFSGGDVDLDLDRVVEEMVSAMSIVTAPQVLNPWEVHDGRVQAGDPVKIPCRFALRYGDEATTDEGGNRAESVRTAFNSPFWPFVLATTSAGQEGIDFHRYCRCVVHWNLPSNPVDLEQREGRVHRYKCLAVRQNVATTWGSRERVRHSLDPWSTLFEVAEGDLVARGARGGAGDEMRPLWVWAGDEDSDQDMVHIERRLLCLPLSREQVQYRRLVRMLGSYRMAFGQPRQEELLALVGPEIAGDSDLARSAMIDLTP